MQFLTILLAVSFLCVCQIIDDKSKSHTISLNSKKENFASFCKRWNRSTLDAIDEKIEKIELSKEEDHLDKYRLNSLQQLSKKITRESVNVESSKYKLERINFIILLDSLCLLHTNFDVLEVNEEGEISSNRNFLIHLLNEDQVLIRGYEFSWGDWKLFIEKRCDKQEVYELLAYIKKNSMETDECITEESFVLTSFKGDKITSYPLVYVCDTYLKILNNQILFNK